MKMIVGLGNPDKNYATTRHNAGFMAIDAFYKTHQDTFSGWSKKFNAEISEGQIITEKGIEKIILVKPQTYMNLSGEAVAPARGFYKVEPQNVIAVFDDADIPFGTLRTRQEGSSGGHNGVKSLIASLGTDKFPRLKIGVGTDEEIAVPREDFVLKKFSTEEQEKLQEILSNAVKEIEKIVTE